MSNNYDIRHCCKCGKAKQVRNLRFSVKDKGFHCMEPCEPSKKYREKKVATQQKINFLDFLAQ